MQSNDFLGLAHRIAVRDRAFFDSLIAFEQTKKLRTKTRLNFTIDSSLALRFRRFCRNQGYNMSAKIEQAMENMIK